MGRRDRDAAAWLLAGAVRLLPPTRREWGAAMRSELAGIGPGHDRWRFAGGCLGTVARLVLPRAAGYVVLALATLTAVVALIRPVDYAPLRWALLAMAATLMTAAWLGQRSWAFGPASNSAFGPVNNSDFGAVSNSAFGPVGDSSFGRTHLRQNPAPAALALKNWGRAHLRQNRAPAALAGILRSGGCLLVAAMAVSTILDMRAPGNNPGEKAGTGVPIYTAVLVFYLAGFLAVTSHRCAATGRVLATGAGAGGAAAAGWLAIALSAPPVPASASAAVVLVAAAIATAAFVNRGGSGGVPTSAKTRLRLRPPGHRGGTHHRDLLAALCAGTVAALLIVLSVAVLARYGPPSLIPDLAPAALTPADDLAQSRVEIEDPYLAVLLLGCLLAIALSIAAVASGRPRSGTRTGFDGRGCGRLPR